MSSPELWLDTLNIYKDNLEAVEAFLADARAMGDGRLNVVLTGAAPPITWVRLSSSTPTYPSVETYLGGESVYTEK